MEYQLEILLDVFIASLLAGLVGIEREISHKPAGFRTHMIIGGSAALLVALGKVLIIHYEASGITNTLRTDPIRIIEAIIVGISFIGAGTILKQQKKNNVLYLTTAATILFSAGIGICVGLKQYWLATGVSILALIINQLLGYVEKITHKGKNYNDQQ